MARDSIVVRTSDGQFWTGSRWSSEYPEARLYTPKEARKVATSFSVNADYARAVQGYGTNGETTIGNE